MKHMLAVSCLVLLAVNGLRAGSKTASDTKLEGKFQTATFSMWWYTLGAAAVRGKKGVIDTTRLVRSKPFGEWVTVYYHPDKVNEEQLLKWIRANRCPRAALVRNKDAVRNPYIAPGDTVQMRIKGSLASSKLPKGWKTTKTKGKELLIQVPKDAKQGDYTLSLTQEDGKVVHGKVSVVRQVGKH